MQLPTKRHKIFIIAGEASGDLLGAHLARSLLALNPRIELLGVGGMKMSQMGVKIIIPYERLAVVGISEVFRKLPIVLSVLHKIKKIFKREKPNLLILIDYPGFNLRVARYAKRLGIKVLFYVSPQIWAWRYGRIKTIKKTVDHMAVLFRFEEKIYRQESIPVSFVGHPLVGIAHTTLTRLALCEKWKLSPQQPIIALFPGSRQLEITRLLPVMRDATRMIRNRFPDAQFVLPLAPNLTPKDVSSYLTPEITLVQDETSNILSICTAAIAASGTVTLQIALQEVPFIIIYKITSLSYQIIKRLIKIPYIGLCNIVAEQRIVPEFIQDEANPKNMADAICRYLEDASYSQRVAHQLGSLKNKLSCENADQGIAELALSLL